MRTPCEIIVWKILPVIRKELAKALIDNYGFNQKKVSDKLGLTESAISRYLSGKRGKTETLDGKILNEIKKSAKRLSKEDGKAVIEETCRICNLLKSSEIIDGINYSCK
jgi:predicted transcriptional regulator